MSPHLKDFINACFEASGILWIGLNCLDMWQKKMAAGQTLTSNVCFSAWGLWNIYYYPSLEQRFSFYCALGVLAMNAVSISLIWRYRKRAL